MDMITYARLKKFATGGGTNPVQSDWNQNDKSALDFIKNKPFGKTSEFIETEIYNTIMTGYSGISQSGGPVFELGHTYKLVFGTHEFIAEARKENEWFGVGYLSAFYNPLPDDMPFCYIDMGNGIGFYAIQESLFEPNMSFCIYHIQPKINSLSREYIEEYLVGRKGNSQDYEYKGQIYNSELGAESFNSSTNVAIGSHSHAEGNNTIALGPASHAEGSGSDSIGFYSHAEGIGVEAIGNGSHAEGSYTKAIGDSSHAEGLGTEATCNESHAEGWYTIANTPFLHVQGAFNIPEENPILFNYIRGLQQTVTYEEDKEIYIYDNRPSLNGNTGILTAGNAHKKSVKELKANDYFSISDYSNSVIEENVCLWVEEVVTPNPDTDTTTYSFIIRPLATTPRNTQPGKYLHIVGNGSVNKNSNAHTLEADGTAWYQGDVYVGSTSGVNRDEGSKKLATEENVQLKFTEAKEYADNAANKVKDDLLNGAGDAYDTLKELGELIDESQDAIEALETIATSKVDWNQNDENALDFIKNKPFYDTGEFKWVDLVINPSMSAAVFGNCYILKPGAPLSLDKEYKVVIDNKEYICSPRYAEYPDGFSGIAIGAETTGGLYLEPSTFKDTSIPFHIVNSSGNSLNAVFPNNQVPTNLQIYVKQADMKLLDRKFIDYIPGERVSGKEVIYDNAQAICGNGAEVFNNLESNMAIGNYSHAEGSATIARQEGAHVEGIENIADGNGAHAEGCGTKAISGFAHSEGYMTSATHQGTHAEGTFTTASGIWSHAEGGYTEAKGKYSHVEGYNTVAATIHSHVQGMYNEIDTEQGNKPIYDKSYLAGGGINSATFNLNEIIYIITNPSLDCQTGLFNADSFTEIEAKDLKINDIFVLNNTNDFKKYYVVTSLENDGEKINIKQDACSSSTTVSLGKYAHIVGNGFSNKTRSNAHTLDWEGNAWYAGSVECTSFILKSSTEGSNKRFRVTIDDNGELHTEEIVE